MFRKGDTVVHPEHGAAVIEDLCVREFLGEKRKYLKLRVSYGDLTLMVPADATEEVGLRNVVSKKEADEVIDVVLNPAELRTRHEASTKAEHGAFR